MAFGDSVTALLETYSNCLKLLKAFSGGKGERDSLSDESLLRRRIKSDRKLVRRAYSSRLSASGRRFEKGDGPARSALRRVLKRLTAAIVNLLSISKHENPMLDYQSLVSLSNASRVDAISAIDQLSHRLGSTSSRGSVASSSASSKHRRHHSSTSHATASSAASDGTRAHKSSKTSKERERERVKTGKKATGPRSRDGKEKPSSPDLATHSRNHSASSRTTVPNRMSIMSIATDSTKIGEIPERKWKRRHGDDTSSGEYNVEPIYPLKPYQPPAPKERKFLGFLKR